MKPLLAVLHQSTDRHNEVMRGKCLSTAFVRTVGMDGFPVRQVNGDLLFFAKEKRITIRRHLLQLFHAISSCGRIFQDEADSR